MGKFFVLISISLTILQIVNSASLPPQVPVDIIPTVDDLVKKVPIVEEESIVKDEVVVPATVLKIVEELLATDEPVAAVKEVPQIVAAPVVSDVKVVKVLPPEAPETVAVSVVQEVVVDTPAEIIPPPGAIKAVDSVEAVRPVEVGDVVKEVPAVVSEVSSQTKEVSSEAPVQETASNVTFTDGPGAPENGTVKQWYVDLFNGGSTESNSAQSATEPNPIVAFVQSIIPSSTNNANNPIAAFFGFVGTTAAPTQKDDLKNSTTQDVVVEEPVTPLVESLPSTVVAQ